MVRDDVSSVSAWSVDDDVRQVLYNDPDASLLDVSTTLLFTKGFDLEFLITFVVVQPSVSIGTDLSITDAAALIARPDVDLDDYPQLVKVTDLESVDGSSLIIDWDEVDQITADVLVWRHTLISSKQGFSKL